jgi:hypothetical protein
LRIAPIAPPFIAVPPISLPPKEYGGTELFAGHLAKGLKKAGADGVLYANGESAREVELRWLRPHSEWPVKVPAHAGFKNAIINPGRFRRRGNDVTRRGKATFTTGTIFPCKEPFIFRKKTPSAWGFNRDV